MGRKGTNLRSIVFALLATGIATTASAIVTINPATGGPPMSDPHVVVGGSLDLNNSPAGHTLPHVPTIGTGGIVELDFYFLGDPLSPRTCTGSVIDMPDGSRAVLTAAHCPKFSTLEQVKTELPALLGGTEPYETCLRNDPDPTCDINDQVKVHPSYNRVNWGYDLALITFKEAIPGWFESYEVADSDIYPFSYRFFVKFGFGCPGYGGTGVNESDLSVYDHTMRWALNKWEKNGLGEHDVEVCNSQVDFRNNETQLVYDFDNLVWGDQNMFWFYGNGTFDPSSNPPFFDNRGYEWGVPGGEGVGCPGDSGGPNFVWDSFEQRWVIVGVTSYIFRMDDDWGGFVGNSDLDASVPTGACGRNETFGEFGGDALIHQDLLLEVLGTVAPSAPATGLTKGAPQNGLGPAPSPPSGTGSKGQ